MEVTVAAVKVVPRVARMVVLLVQETATGYCWTHCGELTDAGLAARAGHRLAGGGVSLAGAAALGREVLFDFRE